MEAFIFIKSYWFMTGSLKICVICFVQDLAFQVGLAFLREWKRL